MSIADLIDEGEHLGIDTPKLDGEMCAVFKRATSFYEQHRNKYDLLPRTTEDTGRHTSAGQPSKRTVTSRPVGRMTASKGPLLELEVSYLILSQKILIDLSRGATAAAVPSFSFVVNIALASCFIHDTLCLFSFTLNT